MELLIGRLELQRRVSFLPSVILEEPFNSPTLSQSQSVPVRRVPSRCRFPKSTKKVCLLFLLQ